MSSRSGPALRDPFDDMSLLIGPSADNLWRSPAQAPADIRASLMPTHELAPEGRKKISTSAHRMIYLYRISDFNIERICRPALLVGCHSAPNRLQE